MMSNKTYTTKDIWIGCASSNEEYYYGENKAVLKYADKVYTCSSHTFQNERIYLPDGTYTCKILTTSELKANRGLVNHVVTLDGRRGSGYYGYSHNILDVFNQFLNDLEDYCFFIAVRNGEQNADTLLKALDPLIPDWDINPGWSTGDYRSINTLKKCVDHKKQELIKQVKETCARKNITIDLSPWYEKVVSKIKIGESIYRKVKPFEGDLMEYKRVKYHIIYADGYETDTFKDTLINNYG